MLGVAAATAVSGILLAPANETLTADQREVMAWAHSESPRGATFAVVGYPADRGMVEWFPALAERVNLTAWQGTEWLASGYKRQD